MKSTQAKFGFKHNSGILMAVSSLPSRYGIGSVGAPAFKFIDFLKECKQRVWQVLPLNPTAYGDSPYQSPCSFAGNPYFVDLDVLKKEFLLCEEDLKGAIDNGDRVDYGKLFETRIPLLKRAYSKFSPTPKYTRFAEKNAGWLDDYALFMTLKEKNDYKSWTEWGDMREYAFAKAHESEFAQECGFWKFVQFEFFSQWKKVREYAKKNEISIVGDMPIYVAYDSVEVWRAPNEFLLDENLVPTVVAGCPPDAFSDDGQLWGNPIYDWKRMKENGYRWWVERAKHVFELYDIVRIDHFRGFAGYYVIPYGDETAKDGHWETGVGYELFAEIEKAVPKAKIIAEDLGHITDDVRELLEKTGYPGMKVLQFAFNDKKNEYLPRNYKTDNCVVYTGTHDSAPTKAWLSDMTDVEKKAFERECPVRFGQSPTAALVAFAMNSPANLAVIPLQDYMELGAEARMNMPSTAQGNWTWRASGRFATTALKNKITTITENSDRA